MFGTPGGGGQMVYGDPEHRLGFAFLTNKMYSGLTIYSPLFLHLYNATYSVIQQLENRSNQ